MAAILRVNHFQSLLTDALLSDFLQIFQSCDILSKYGRSPQIDSYVVELRQLCDEIWTNGKQQCEALR